MGAIWFTLGVVNETMWALPAGRLRPFLATRDRLRNRVSGGSMVGAGVAFAPRLSKPRLTGVDG